MPRSPLFIAVATVFLIGWGGNPSDSPLQASGHSGQLQLSLNVPKAEYVVGEMVQVTMILRNVSPGPVALRPSTLRPFDFAVYDDSGQQIGTWAGGRPFPMAPPLPITLQPGEVITRPLAWDLALPGPQGRKPLPPGRYGLEGFLSGSRDIRRGVGRLGVWPGVYPLPLRTPRLFITVR